jgi:hypothetical protein
MNISKINYPKITNTLWQGPPALSQWTPGWHSPWTSPTGRDQDPCRMLLHLQDKNTQTVVILFLQEMKYDVFFRHAQLNAPRRQEELQPHYKKVNCSQLSTKFVPYWNTRASSLLWMHSISFDTYWFMTEYISFLPHTHLVIYITTGCTS